MDARAAVYTEIANITVSTDGRHPYEVVDQVLTELTALRDKLGRFLPADEIETAS